MKKIEVDENIIYFAFKYVLGRKSTAPSMVMDSISKHMETLTNPLLTKLIQDIDNCEDLGMEVDAKNWKRLRKDIKREQDLRKTLPPKVNV